MKQNVKIVVMLGEEAIIITTTNVITGVSCRLAVGGGDSVSRAAIYIIGVSSLGVYMEEH